MNTILFDGAAWSQLLPLTYTRPTSEIRCGILTLSEKWKSRMGGDVSYATRSYLAGKFTVQIESENLFVAGNVLPNEKLAKSIEALEMGQCLTSESKIIAFKCDKNEAEELAKQIAKGKLDFSRFHEVVFEGEFACIEYSWDIFSKNGNEIKNDIELLGLTKNGDKFKTENTIFGEDVYVEEGAKVRGVILNSTDGPIHIGKDAEVMEGSVIRGPFSLGEHATIKMASKIYGDTTIGPHCKVGGEVSNVVMFAYSNKGHDGFIGNSVIGEWCNFGADTNSSNLKNNYSPVRVWSYKSEEIEETGLQFCGLIAGDHCKTGINTMLNTATVLGVCANVFGGDFPPKFIPSFSWGGAKRMVSFKLEKAYEVADNMMKRRGLSLSLEDKKIFQHIFISDSLYRK